MFEADDPYTLKTEYETLDTLRKRVNKELDEFEKNKKKKEVKLKATKKDHISFIRKLATQRGFISKVSGYLFPKDIIVSRFHSNVKCDNLHEDVIKKYYDENNGKEDLSSAYFIPNIKEERHESREVKRNPEKWKQKFEEREEKGLLFSLPSSSKDLPINNYTEEIISGIKSNRVFIISGETGCGKSTQVPQMILNDKELGSEACIICCQPRRLCAVGLAERVAEERGEKVGETVSYSIRLDSKLNESTQLEYVTTGLLLRRLNNDSELKGISHLIIDEAHERDQFLDFLLVYVKDKLLKLNPKIHVIIMSATLQIEKICNYFDKPKMIQCEGKMFHVKEYWLDEIKKMVEEPTETKADDEEEEEGDVEDEDLDIDKSNIPLPPSTKSTPKIETDENDENDEIDLRIDNNLIVSICRYIICNTDSTEEDAILIFLPGWGEILELEDMLKKDVLCESCNILPLHSNLPNEEQSKIFKKASEGKEEDKSNARKIILSTNVAETSLTIDEVKYVIDAGLMKVNKYDSQTKITSLTTEPISQANVRQRAGRAGRTKEGECYHLYTKEQQNKMNEYPIPEIQRILLDEVILRTRSIDRKREYRICDFLSKLLDPPDVEMINTGIELLQSYGALDKDENLTKIGEYINDIPVLPKYAYMLLLSVLFRCYDSVVNIVCILNVNDIFKNTSKKKEKEKLKQFKRENSKVPDDFVFLIQTYANVQSGKISEKECKKNKILFKKEMVKYITKSMINAKIITSAEVATIGQNKNNLHLVTQILAMVLFPQVGVHIKKTNNFMYNEEAGGEAHPSSVVRFYDHRNDGDSKLLIFDEVNRDNKDKIYFQYVAIVNPLNILLCSPYNFEVKEEESKDGNLVVRLSEKFRMTVNKDYYKYIKFIKTKLRYLYHKFINNPSDVTGTDKHSEFFELIKVILT